jgi:hypothetical protein
MRIILLFLFLFLASCKKDAAVQFTAGASSEPVNPPSGTFIAGADRNRVFTGVKDSLFVKAVVMNDGRTSVALVTIDCIGLLNPEIRQIQKLAAAASSVPAENIIVSSTHTHAGPDVVGIWGPDPLTTGRDSAYLNFLVEAAARQIINADKNRVAAQMHGTEGIYTANWFSNICKEEVDPGVSVIRISTTSGAPLASLTNFACHPTFLDTHFSVVSADYPGAFYRQMDRKLGGINLFLQGAIGGWVQPADELFTGKGSSVNQPEAFMLADRYGKDLADSVLQLLKSAAKIEDPVINYRNLDFKFPVDNQNWKLLSQAGVIKREFTDSVQTTISWFSVGNAQFVTHPGETTPWLGLKTKALMKSGPRFVLGLSQDALGYIVKPEFFTDSTRLHAGYLTGMSLGPRTTPILLNKLESIIP